MTTRRGDRAKTLRPRFKLWVACDDAASIFGGGKWRLLRAIQDTGSLKAATERLGISYRKAWGDLSKAERTLGIAFLEKRRGGRTGGETRLTETGRRWMTEYGRFQAKVEKTVDAAFQTWLKRIRE